MCVMNSAQETCPVTQELLLLSGASTLAAAVEKLGLAPSGMGAALQVKVSGWRRGGAETYILPFSLSSQNGEDSPQFILKACITPCIERQIDAVVGGWLERRKTAEENGIHTPHFYGYKGGVILEEFIPASLGELVQDAPKEKMVKQLASLYGTLGALGFQPICIAKDLRVSNDNIYMIDFGEDLGASTGRKVDLWPLFEKELRGELNLHPEPSTLNTLRHSYRDGSERVAATVTIKEKKDLQHERNPGMILLETGLK